MNIRSTKKNTDKLSLSEIIIGTKYGSEDFMEFIFSLILPFLLMFVIAGIGHDSVGSIFSSKMLHVGGFISILVVIFTIFAINSSGNNKGVFNRILLIHLFISIGCIYTIETNPFTTISDPVTQVQFITKDKKSCQISIQFKSKSLELDYCAENKSDLIYIKADNFFNKGINREKITVILTANSFLGTTAISGIEFIEEAKFL